MKVTQSYFGGTMTIARVLLDEYSNKVINVVKAKYSLKDKSEALNKFIHTYGQEETDLDAKDEYVEKVEKIVENHYKKYGYQNMSLEELDKLFKKE
ncbi:MAG: DUF2683 family protein [Candidatus Diapherotrites archaeon]|nr:DUF2683 family protein [Candidatus Diapherotrites archaeon]